jgi:hypothetical protein
MENRVRIRPHKNLRTLKKFIGLPVHRPVRRAPGLIKDRDAVLLSGIIFDMYDRRVHFCPDPEPDIMTGDLLVSLFRTSSCVTLSSRAPSSNPIRSLPNFSRELFSSNQPLSCIYRQMKLFSVQTLQPTSQPPTGMESLEFFPCPVHFT